MSTEQEPHDSAPAKPAPSPQEEQPARSEGHAGHGSESAMKQMRVWEQRRANNSAGKGREGPD